MFASVYALTFLFRGAGVVATEASALAVAACARRTLFAVLNLPVGSATYHSFRC